MLRQNLVSGTMIPILDLYFVEEDSRCTNDKQSEAKKMTYQIFPLTLTKQSADS
jgi:hypothetical protein